MRIAGALVAVTALLGVGSATAATSATVKGRAFTTKAPSGWLLKVTKGERRFVSYALTSQGAVDAVSVPDKGQLAVSVYETPLDEVRVKHPRRASLGALATALLAVPREAAKVTRTTTGTTALDGEDALTATYTYTYRSRRIRQQDTVARRGSYAVVVETIGDTSSRAGARKARARVQGSWRWR